MTDALGWRAKFAVLVPSTNTSVQPEFDGMRPPGVTNHISRIRIPNMPLENDDDFSRLVDLAPVLVALRQRAVARHLRPRRRQAGDARRLIDQVLGAHEVGMVARQRAVERRRMRPQESLPRVAAGRENGFRRIMLAGIAIGFSRQLRQQIGALLPEAREAGDIAGIVAGHAGCRTETHAA